jgi:hypothetical protein
MKLLILSAKNEHIERADIMVKYPAYVVPYTYAKQPGSSKCLCYAPPARQHKMVDVALYYYQKIKRYFDYYLIKIPYYGFRSQ